MMRVLALIALLIGLGISAQARAEWQLKMRGFGCQIIYDNPKSFIDRCNSAVFIIETSTSEFHECYAYYEHIRARDTGKTLSHTARITSCKLAIRIFEGPGNYNFDAADSIIPPSKIVQNTQVIWGVHKTDRKARACFKSTQPPRAEVPPYLCADINF